MARRVDAHRPRRLVLNVLDAKADGCSAAFWNQTLHARLVPYVTVAVARAICRGGIEHLLRGWRLHALRVPVNPANLRFGRIVDVHARPAILHQIY